MYLLRIDNMATSGYSSLILTPITETFILFIHSAMGTSGYLHDLFITPSPLSCYIYLLSLNLSIVKSFSGRKNLWRDFGVHRDIVIIEHSTN